MICDNCRTRLHEKCLYPTNCTCQHRKKALIVDKDVDKVAQPVDSRG